MSSITDEIKARVDLVELIGGSVGLRRSGSSFKGLCPFHQEKTPSFYVFPDSRTFVCFGCGKKGTAFDWLMEREHLEFGEALRTLAAATGVTLPSRREPEQEESETRLYDVLARAQSYYSAALAGATGGAARRYLAARGVAVTSTDEFGLGYAPAGNGLLSYLKDAGVSDEDLEASGVISIADDGRRYDFFRNRLLFPIRDVQGRTIAFGGRAMDETIPKYLNTRDTLLFHKQETLYALDLARKPIATERRAVVVEGYFDALMAHQHGYRNVVATLGTAVTVRHLTVLRRLSDEVVLALDSDAAGQAATWRALQLAEQSLQEGVRPVVGPNRRRMGFVPSRSITLKVLTLPAAKDPDDLIRSDPSAWPTLVKQASPIVDFALAQLAGRHDLSAAKGKAEAVREVADLVASIGNPIEKAHYTQQVADLLGVSEAVVHREMRARVQSRPPNEASSGTSTASDSPSASAPTPPSADTALDEYVLALFLQAQLLELLPEGESASIDSMEFTLPEASALFAAFKQLGPIPHLDKIRGSLDEVLLGLYDRVVSRLADTRRLAHEQLLSEIEQGRAELRYRSLVVRKQEVQRLVRDVDESERSHWARELSELAHQLDVLGSQLRGVTNPVNRGAAA